MSWKFELNVYGQMRERRGGGRNEGKKGESEKGGL